MDDRDRKRGRMTMMRHAYHTASDAELHAIDKEYQDEWALLQGDYWAGDLSEDEGVSLVAQIRWCEWNIKTIEREMMRRLRAGVRKDNGVQEENWTGRFDNMRQQSIVEGLSMLGLDLHKKGKEYKAQCPFHDDDTPSLSVNQNKNVWTCYSCQRGGDLVEFVTLLYGKSRGEALMYLEKMYGSVATGSWSRPAEPNGGEVEAA